VLVYYFYGKYLDKPKFNSAMSPSLCKSRMPFVSWDTLMFRK